MRGEHAPNSADHYRLPTGDRRRIRLPPQPSLVTRTGAYETLITNAEAHGASEVTVLLQQNLEQDKHALRPARTSMKTIAHQGIAVTATT